MNAVLTSAAGTYHYILCRVVIILSGRYSESQTKLDCCSHVTCFPMHTTFRPWKRADASSNK